MCSYDGRKDDLSGVVVGKSDFHTVAVGKERGKSKEINHVLFEN